MPYRIFDAYAQDYDAWFERNPLIVENEVSAIRLLGEPCHPSLELGVGTGFFASRLGIEHGIDPALNALSLALKRGILVVRSVGEHLPYRDNVFCSIYVIVTICFADDPLGMLVEARRVLRDDGRLILCFIPSDSSWGSFYLLKKRRGQTVFYREARFYSRRFVRDLLVNAGFEITRFSSALRFSPMDPPVIEEPEYSANGSFVCFEAVPAGKKTF